MQIARIQAYLPSREATLMMETFSMQQPQSKSETDISLQSLYHLVESLNQHLSAATTQNATLLCNGLEQLEKRLSMMQRRLDVLQETLNLLNPSRNHPGWEQFPPELRPQPFPQEQPPPIPLITLDPNYAQQSSDWPPSPWLRQTLPNGKGLSQV